MSEKKEVAKKENTALVNAGMYETDADAGFEDADADSYAIPYLTILQALSPQCDKSKGEYIKGAESGEIFNSVSEERYEGIEKGIDIIPVHYKRAFTEWLPNRGGFVAEHSTADGLDLLKQCEKNDNNQDVLPNGNTLIDMRSHYVLILGEDGSTTGAVMSMSSTQMKKSKRWMTVMQNIKMAREDGSKFTPPMFSHKYHVTSVPESNDQGSWFGWKIANAGQIEDANLYNAAKSFRDAILSGEAKEAAPEAPGEAKEQF
jgi:hypothetical protein